jgi:hypothetical protein
MQSLALSQNYKSNMLFGLRLDQACQAASRATPHWPDLKHRISCAAPDEAVLTEHRRQVACNQLAARRCTQCALRTTSSSLSLHLKRFASALHAVLVISSDPPQSKDSSKAMTDTTRPESITGGCLCGAVRFTITFPNESDWPPLSVRTHLIPGFRRPTCSQKSRTVSATAPCAASTPVPCCLKTAPSQPPT